MGKKTTFAEVINHKTLKTMQNFNIDGMRLGNRLAAGKEPVGDFPKLPKCFVGFEGFVIKNRML